MTPEKAPLRLQVLVIGDDPFRRNSIVQYIHVINPSATVDEAANRADADEMARASEWNLIIVELDDANELTGLRRLKQLQLSAPILVITTAATPDDVTAVLAAGASGCLNRGNAVSEWRRAIESISSGGTYLGLRS